MSLHKEPHRPTRYTIRKCLTYLDLSWLLLRPRSNLHHNVIHPQLGCLFEFSGDAPTQGYPPPQVTHPGLHVRKHLLCLIHYGISLTGVCCKAEDAEDEAAVMKRAVSDFRCDLSSHFTHTLLTHCWLSLLPQPLAHCLLASFSLFLTILHSSIDILEVLLTHSSLLPGSLPAFLHQGGDRYAG